MPALVALGCRWGLGSDDLAIPAGLDASASLLWLVTAGRCIYRCYSMLSPESLCWFRWFCVGSLAWNSANLLVNAALVHVNFQGTVINALPRLSADPLLRVKLLLGVSSLMLSGAGAWLTFVSDWVDMTPDLSMTFRLTARATWAMTAVSSIILWHILNPYKHKKLEQEADIPLPAPRRLSGYSEDGSTEVSHDLEQTQSMAGAVTEVWVQRFNKLGQLLGIEGHPALDNLGELVAEVIQEENCLDIVPTDVIGALMILQQTQQERTLGCHGNKQTADTGAVTPEHWMTSTEASHYMKYAAGGYGWPMYIWSSRLALWGLLRVLVRSRFYPKPMPENVHCDGYLMANTTVLKMVTGLQNDQLVYITFHSAVHKVPFYIALDHEEQAVIVAIRGTLSLEDILTDLSAYEAVPLEVPGRPDMTAHAGMFYAAQYIQGELLGAGGESDDSGLLAETYSRIGQDKGIEYSLVVVGHSLGAGVAAILAILMKGHPRYGPRLKCFSYSPPGGLLSLVAAEYCREFVCSVVLGDDIVSRIGLVNIYNLKIDVLSKLCDLDVPKHQIFTGWFINLLYKALGTGERNLSSTGDEHSWTGLPDQQKTVQTFQTQVRAAIEQNRKLAASKPCMYPPGCVLYISHDKSNNEHTSQFVENNSYRFGEIFVDGNLIGDHTPWAVLHALKTLAEKDRNC